jgi:hypothetical protein
MKPVKTIITCKRLVLLCIYIAASSFQLKSQCGATLKSTSYNILSNGTGNNLWGFSLPQFDPAVGTLVAVDIKSIVSVNAKFSLYNLSGNQDNFAVVAGRNDIITVNALSTPVTNSFSQNYATYNLGASQDTVGAGTVANPQFFSLLNSYVINDSVITSVAGFLGHGYVSFNYQPQTYVSVTSGSSYDVNNAFSDTMKISVTYYYCIQNILAADITSFFVKEADNFTKISWQTENETIGRTYQIEESTDGKIFNDIAALESVVNYDGNGSYGYIVPESGANIFYFRIKEIDADGSYKYSEIRTTEVENSSEMYLYPNPSNSFINVVFKQSFSKNWAVEIYAANGALVQKNYFTNSTNAYIPFAKVLSAGVYFIRTTDQQAQKKYTSSFVVQ